MSVELRPLPDDALLQRYANGWEKPGKPPYTDCFVLRCKKSVSLEDYVRAFYTSRLFRLERWLIRLAARRPSTDQQVAELAAAQREDFAVWTVEARREHELLLKDLGGRTRSWLRVSAASGGTDLWFGSAVLPKVDRDRGRSTLGWVFSALLGFHKIYSRGLLVAAARRLARTD
ncbi:MAG: hypothetical protein AAF552_13270 [Pseudomonadota bacterium]